jgi:hypothetical protein
MELYFLNRVVGIESVSGTIDMVVAGTTLDFLFVPSRSMLVLTVSEDTRSSYGCWSGSSIGLEFPTALTTMSATALGCGTTLFSPPPSSAMG